MTHCYWPRLCFCMLTTAHGEWLPLKVLLVGKSRGIFTGRRPVPGLINDFACHDQLIGGTCFFYILGIIIPTDFHIFRGVETTNRSKVTFLPCSSGWSSNHVHRDLYTPIIRNPMMGGDMQQSRVLTLAPNWLVAWNIYFFDFPFSWECHHPN